jgi:hypothetical protein
MRKKNTAKLIAAIFSLQLVACDEIETRWGEIEAKPQSYVGKKISICGWLRVGFEVCSLSKAPSKDFGGPGMIWISPADGDCSSADDSTEKQGWHVVSGKYAHSATHPSSGFGHLGAYEAEITEATIVATEKGCDVSGNLD